MWNDFALISSWKKKAFKAIIKFTKKQERKKKSTTGTIKIHHILIANVFEWLH